MRNSSIVFGFLFTLLAIIPVNAQAKKVSKIQPIMFSPVAIASTHYPDQVLNDFMTSGQKEWELHATITAENILEAWQKWKKDLLPRLSIIGLIPFDEKDFTRLPSAASMAVVQYGNTVPQNRPFILLKPKDQDSFFDMVMSVEALGDRNFGQKIMSIDNLFVLIHVSESEIKDGSFNLTLTITPVLVGANPGRPDRPIKREEMASIKLAQRISAALSQTLEPKS
jgi:hypothetical protein